MPLKTFITIQRNNDAIITNFQVIGERSSGTNFLNALIRRNLNIPWSYEYGWKHGFPHKVAYNPQALFVVSFRDAFSWVKSMHSKPWHTTAAMQKLEFSEFIRAVWATETDSPSFFKMCTGYTTLGQPLQLDLNPISGRPFENLIAMRNVKISAFLGIIHRHANVVLVNYEKVAERPEEFINGLADTYGLTYTKPLARITKRLGADFPAKIGVRPSPPDKISQDDHYFIRTNLDLPQESRIGYIY